jgi:hypothetical protein
VSSTTTSLQINLLPDVRLAKQRAVSQRRVVGLIATLVCGFAVGLVVIAFAVTLAQAHRISNQTTQIGDLSSQLMSKSDLNDVVTLQQHVTALGPLFKERLYLTNFFGIMQNVATSEISINNLTFQTTSGTLVVTGHAKSFAAADKYVKVMQSNVADAKAKDGTPYFTNLVINGLTRDGTNTNFSFTVHVNPEATNG